MFFFKCFHFEFVVSIIMIHLVLSSAVRLFINIYFFFQLKFFLTLPFLNSYFHFLVSVRTKKLKREENRIRFFLLIVQKIFLVTFRPSGKYLCKFFLFLLFDLFFLKIQACVSCLRVFLDISHFKLPTFVDFQLPNSFFIIVNVYTNVHENAFVGFFLFEKHVSFCFLNSVLFQNFCIYSRIEQAMTDPPISSSGILYNDDSLQRRSSMRPSDEQVLEQFENVIVSFFYFAEN